MGTPQISCSTFARRDFMRVPCPAASTITAVSLNSIFLSSSVTQNPSSRHRLPTFVSDPRRRKRCRDSRRSDRPMGNPSCSHPALAPIKQRTGISESMANERSGPPLRAPHSSKPNQAFDSPSGAFRLGFAWFACPLAAGFPTLASNGSHPCECRGVNPSRSKSTAIPAASRRARRKPSNGSVGDDSRQTASSRTTSLAQ